MLTRSGDEAGPTLGVFTLGTTRKLDGDSTEKPESIIIKWNAIHNVQVQPIVAQATRNRLFPSVRLPIGLADPRT